MNFYKHYIGDFQRDTGHLSLTERGAYLALIHHYYATEMPLPNNIDSLCRIAGAVSPIERKAVKAVLPFFEVVDSGLMHARIEVEIHKAGEVSNTNRDIALAREAKRRAEKEAKKEHESSTNRAKDVPRKEHENSTNQTPDTRHQSKLSNTQEDNTVVEPTMIARVCSEISEIFKQHNFKALDLTHSNQKIIALIKAGATVEEFRDSAMAAMQSVPPKNLSWALGRLKNIRDEVLNTNYAKGTVAPKEDLSWRGDDNQIYLKAQSLKIHTTGKSRIQILSEIDKKRELQRTAA